VLQTAATLSGRQGITAPPFKEVAKAAKVPLGALRYHFRSPEHLVIEAQRATFRAIHERFEERFAQGQTGVHIALEALDALWNALRELREFAPFLVHTASAAASDEALGERLADFNREAITRVELGLMRLFPTESDRLVMPADQLAHAIRIGMYGLLVELAAVRTDAELAQLDDTYAQVRGLLGAVVLAPPPEGETSH